MMSGVSSTFLKSKAIFGLTLFVFKPLLMLNYYGEFEKKSKSAF